jgi:carboxymethylenebutenolidase
MRTSVSIGSAHGGRLHAVVAMPDGVAPSRGWPGAVIVHEVFGMAPEVLDVADRFAAHGWVGVVPDLFSAGNRFLCVLRTMVESRSTRPGRVTAELEATRAWLATRPNVDGARLAVIGFCLGGGFALVYAASAPDGVRAASVNYGGVPRDRSALRNICPVVASFGRRDRVYGPQAKRLEDHLQALGVAHDVKLYADAGHSFMTDGHHPVGRIVFFPMHLGYAPADADDAWARTFAFFDQHVMGAS